MKEEIVFYTNPMSRGRMVRWMLEEMNEPYRTEVLEYGASMKSPEYLAINPMGKVPAIQHNGSVVTEGAAICAYLADAFPQTNLAPPLGNRGAYYRWLFYFAGPVEAAVTNKSLGFEVPADRQVMAGYGSYEAVMDTLELAVSGNAYIAGEQFTAADVYCGSHIGWGMEFGSIEKRPAFVHYWSNLKDRDALKRAAELDDALIPETEDRTQS